MATGSQPPFAIEQQPQGQACMGTAFKAMKAVRTATGFKVVGRCVA
jgi:hypothetical protein